MKHKIYLKRHPHFRTTKQQNALRRKIAHHNLLAIRLDKTYWKLERAAKLVEHLAEAKAKAIRARAEPILAKTNHHADAINALHTELHHSLLAPKHA